MMRRKPVNILASKCTVSHGGTQSDGLTFSHCSTRIIDIQTELAERALELLALPEYEGLSTLRFESNKTHDEDMLTGDAEDVEENAMESEETSSMDDGSNTTDRDSDHGDDSDHDDESDDSENSDDEQSSFDGKRGKQAASKPKTPYLILDIGVGSGLCASVLEEKGHVWAGLDISQSMLDVAQARQREQELGPGDLMLSDMGEGMPFRPGVFDGAISISALQWLCNADKRSHSPRSRLTRLFTTLYGCLRHGARAVFQFYPENSAQIDMVLESSLKVGFTGGLVIDYPNSTKRKKYFLCLIAGSSMASVLPKARSDSDDEMEEGSSVSRSARQIKTQGAAVQGAHPHASKFGKKKGNVKDRDWVLRKKELMRKRGYEVPDDSKYTARKRRVRF